MARVCTGTCGLTTDAQGRLIVKTPGAWPYAGTPASNGHPIYCDPSGGGLYAEPGTGRPVVVTSVGSSQLTRAQIGNAKTLKFRVQNAGPSGGSAAGNGAGASSAGGGASGGAYAERTVAVAGLTFPLQIHNGTPGAAVFTDGSILNTQSWVIDNNGTGTILCTPGVPSATSIGHFGSSGTAVGGCGVGGFNVNTTFQVADFVVIGDTGENALRLSAGMAIGGAGGGSFLGGGGNANSFTGGPGQPGQGWGGGGAGSSSHASQGLFLSGAGGPAIVIVELGY